MMNKRIHLLSLGLFTACALFFTGCHDDIYYMINQEVTLETNGITGGINSIVRFGTNLYTQNGNVYCKDVSKTSSVSGLYNEQWKKIVDISSDATFSGMHCEYLASDAKYLYGFFAPNYHTDDGENEPETKNIYCTADGETWSKIDLSSLGITDDNSVSYIKIIFCNRAVAAADRIAYANLYDTTTQANHVYQLNGTSAPTLIADGTNNAGSATIAAARYKGAEYFSNYRAFTANDTYIYYAKNGSTIYYADTWDSTNGYTLAGTETGINEDDGSIYDIAITSDYLLFGTSAGVTHVALANNLPANGTSDFSNNAASTLTSSYIVYNIFALDPTLPEYSNDLYGTTEYEGSYSSSTSALFNEIGLWAYYPNRGTWNKDGTSDTSTKGN